MRLKAARWLVGEPYEDTDKKGAPKWKVRALSPEALAEREPLKSNGISANMVGEIERMERPSFPMELEKVADALGVDHDFLTSPLRAGDHGPAGGLRRELLGDLPNPQAPEQEDEDEDEGHAGGAQA